MGHGNSSLYPHRFLWVILRAATVVAIGTVFFLLVTGEQLFGLSGLELFWALLMPTAVLTMYFAPLLWRNVCPLSTVSLWHWSLFGRRRLEREGMSARILTGWRAEAHEFLTKKGLVVSAVLFWAIVPLRIPFFNGEAQATLWLLAIVFLAAAIAGALFPVKSGWCTSICPIAAVEKVYGMNPAVQVGNARCHYRNKETGTVASCSGCSFNCGDVVEPEHAYWQAEKGGLFHDTANAEIRKAFIGSFPGFLSAFYLYGSKTFTLPGDPFIGILVLYMTFAAFMGASALVYMLVKRRLRAYSERCEGIIRSDAVCVSYAVSKRRLDMVFLTLSINIVVGFAFNNPVVERVLLERLSLTPEMGMIVLVALASAFFLVSLYSLRNAWNEQPVPGRYRPSWW
jgi:hypothetical protein